MTSRTAGETKRSSSGPVCTRKPARSPEHRERLVEGDHLRAGHLTEHGRVERIAEDSRGLQDGAITGVEAGDARGDEAAQRLRQREVLADELLVTTEPSATVTARLDEGLLLLDHLRMPAGALL